MSDPWAALEWVPTLYPEIETAWSAEDGAYLARWVGIGALGPMADGEDRADAVRQLIEVTKYYFDEPGGGAVAREPLIERPAALLLLLALILSIATAHLLNAWWADDTTCVECVEVGNG